MTDQPKRIYVQRSALTRLERRKGKMDAVGVETTQISLREIKASVAYAPAHNGCADCKIKSAESENYPEQCGECRWFYADLRVAK